MALARMSCRRTISAWGRFRVSKKTGSVADSQRTLRVLSVVSLLKIFPGVIVGTNDGLMIGIISSWVYFIYIYFGYFMRV